MLLSGDQVSCKDIENGGKLFQEFFNYFNSTVRNMKLRNRCVTFKEVIFFGAWKLNFTTIQETLALDKIGVKCQTIKCFSICVVNSLQFTTVLERSNVRCDWVAQSDGDFFQIQKIFVCKSVPMCCCKINRSSNTQNVNIRLQSNPESKRNKRAKFIKS